MLTVGSLFSGIGGLDLGLERAGMKVIWQSEIDDYASRVLKKHWPKVPNYGDIKKINWQEIEKPDVICGGYPCQPFSTAGKRRGEEDPRHLWPWVREAISELRPSYAILENVRGHLSMGGLSVIAELTAIGYDAEWRVVSAASVGANHRRDRIIIVAYTNNARNRTPRSNIDRNRQAIKQERQNESQLGVSGRSAYVANPNSEQFNGGGHRNSKTAPTERQTVQIKVNRSSSNGHLANTNGERLERQRPEQQTTGTARNSETKPLPYADTWETSRRHGGVQSDTETVFRGPSDRRGTESYAGWQWWEVEPNVGRVAHGIPSRVDRLKGLGNAVVPQVAEVIGCLVVEHAQHN